MLVEDPENVLAGRYALTSAQKTEAAHTAEAVLNSTKEKDLQKAFSMRLRRCGCGSSDLFASCQRARNLIHKVNMTGCVY